MKAAAGQPEEHEPGHRVILKGEGSASGMCPGDSFSCRRIPEVTCKGAERGDRSHGSDQISWAQLPAALPPPCDLGVGSVITPCRIFAICPVGTIVLSIWEEKQSPGIGSLRRLPGAAVQDSLCVEHLHWVKTVLEN